MYIYKHITFKHAIYIKANIALSAGFNARGWFFSEAACAALKIAHVDIWSHIQTHYTHTHTHTLTYSRVHIQVIYFKGVFFLFEGLCRARYVHIRNKKEKWKTARRDGVSFALRERVYEHYIEKKIPQHICEWMLYVICAWCGILWICHAWDGGDGVLNKINLIFFYIIWEMFVCTTEYINSYYFFYVWNTLHRKYKSMYKYVR